MIIKHDHWWPFPSSSFLQFHDNHWGQNIYMINPCATSYRLCLLMFGCVSAIHFSPVLPCFISSIIMPNKHDKSSWHIILTWSVQQSRRLISISWSAHGDRHHPVNDRGRRLSGDQSCHHEGGFSLKVTNSSFWIPFRSLRTISHWLSTGRKSNKLSLKNYWCRPIK